MGLATDSSKIREILETWPLAMAQAPLPIVQLGLEHLEQLALASTAIPSAVLGFDG